jgi:iron(III) transport system substrate-binding protein
LKNSQRLPRRLPRRRVAALAILVTAGVALTGCSAAGNTNTNGKSLVLYNAQHEQTTAALVAAFTRQTGITVKIDNDDEDVLTAKIQQEGSRSPADLFFTENSNWLQILDNASLLSKVDAASLASIPAADSAANGDWVAVSARVSALVYDTKDLSAAELPTSVLQLADPKWKGRIEIAPAETDFWPIISSVEKAYGHARALAWLEGLKTNAGTKGVVPDNEALVDDVNKGVTDLGLINHYYFNRLEAEKGSGAINSALGYFAAGDPGYLKTYSGIAILKSSRNQDAAQKFVAFLTSAAGQEALAKSDSFEYPLAAGVDAPSSVTPLATLHPLETFTPSEFGTGDDAKKLLQEAQLL